MHLVTVHAVPEAFVRGAPVFESGESALRGWTGVVVPSLRGSHLVVRWENDSRGMETSLTGGTALDLRDPLGRAAAFSYLRARVDNRDARLRRLEEDGLEQALAWSVLSVSQGGGVLADILHPWREVTQNDPDTGAAWIRGRAFDPKNHGGGLFVASFLRPWRTFGWENGCVPTGPEHPGRWLRGPEVGAEGRAAADRSALEACFGLMNEDGTLTLPPLPQGKP